MKIELKEGREKPRIGIMFGNYHSDHPRRLLRNMYDLLLPENVDVRFYLGTESSSFLTDFGVKGNRYDYQYASFYGMSRYDDLDLLIVSSGTLSIFQDWITTDELLDSLPKVPMILLENETDIDDRISIIPDNYGAIQETIEHLVNKHGLKKILYISGPNVNFESRKRLKGYLDTMKKLGIDMTGDMIAYGDFSENVDDEVEALLDANPDADAIVSANDEMAVAIYRICEKRGIKIGQDLAVTGFDDAEIAKYMDPPLTTCRQDYDLLSKCVIEKAVSLMRGGNASSEKVEAPFIIRASCGCRVSEEIEKDKLDVDERNEMLSAKKERLEFQRDVWKGNLLMRDMIPETADIKEFVRCVGNFLSLINVSRSYISLFENPRKTEPKTMSDFTDTVRLYLVQDGKDITAFGQDDAPVLTGSDTEETEKLIRPGFYVSFLLYYEKYQYGTLNVEIEPSRIDFFYLISLDLGSSFRHLHMSIERERYRAELQALARHDNLTGLYNRLGMAGNVAGYVKVNKDRLLVAMMADLDHLKQINDTFGHGAGDTAICKSAAILRKVVGKLAPLGRTGGDEFMAVFAVNSEKDIDKARRKIHDALEKYNAKSNNPFYVELSVGFHSFKANEFKDLSSVMEIADGNLYEAKKNRRESVIK